MKPMIDEIENFISTSDLSVRTKRRYRVLLLLFANFLTTEINVPIEQVYLNKIGYLPFDDVSGIHLPINAPIIDKYLEVNVYRRYSWLAHSTSALSSFFEHLATQYNFRNVVKDIEFRTRTHYIEPTIRAFNRQEILKFLITLIKYSENVIQDALLFITLFTTGCRINEVLSLTMKDLRFDEHTFFLARTKNKRQMYVATKLGLMTAFRKYCKTNNLTDSDRLFSLNGKPLTDDDVRDKLKHFSELGCLRPTRVHDTRRSFVTIMYENGSDISVIQQMVNHVTLNSTQHYLDDNSVRNSEIRISMYDELMMQCRPIIESRGRRTGKR